MPGTTRFAMTKATDRTDAATERARTDATLLAACGGGDLAAFSRLVERYQTLICAISYSAAGDRALSEDIAQETFLAMWTARDSIRDPAKLRSWLCTTARHKAHNAVRARRTVPLADDHDVAAAEGSPYDQLAERQEEAAVWSALARVPETYREPLVLYYRDGRSLDGVAASLGLSLDAAKQRLARGRQELRAMLERVERRLGASGPQTTFAAIVVAALAARVGVAQAAASAGGGTAGRASARPSGGKASHWTRSPMGRAVAVAALVAVVVGAGFELVGDRPDGKAAAVAPTTGSAPAPLRKRAPAASPATDEAGAAASGDEAAPDPTGDLRLEGQVVDERGEPVGGASVTVSTSPPSTVTSGADGFFAIDGLLPRSYRFEAHRTPLVSAAMVVLATESTEPLILTLRVGSTLELTVLDERTGAPIAGAGVELGAEHLDRAATTDAQGRVRLGGLLAATSWFTVRAPGYGFVAQRVEPSGMPDDVLRRTVHLGAGRAVAGRVRDAAGAPVAGARIRPTGSFLAQMVTTTSDADGRWRFDDLPPGTYVFAVADPRYAPARSGTVDLSVADATASVELVLAPGLTIGGLVVDDDGEPVAFAEVEVQLAGEAGMKTSADLHGHFFAGGLGVGAVQLIARRFPQTSAVETVELTASRADVTLTVAPGVIRGVVTRGGQPVVGVQVAAVPTDYAASLPVTARDVTSSMGEFVLGPLPAQLYRILATQPGASQRFAAGLRDSPTARPGDEEIVVELSVGGRITGRIVGADGRAPADVSVALSTFVPGLSFAASAPVHDGVLALDDVAPDTYVIAVDGAALGHQVIEDIVVTAGVTTDLGTITVDEGRVLSGQVVTSDGSPVANALVMAGRGFHGDGASVVSPVLSLDSMVHSGARQARSDSAGRFRMPGLSAGPIVVIADAPALGRSRPRALVEGDDGADASLELVVEPTARLTGRITAGGAPVVRARVTASVTDNVSQNVSTDAEGRYAFDRLSAGDYCLTVGQGSFTGSNGTPPTCGVALAPGAVARRDLELGGGGVELRLEFQLGDDDLTFTSTVGLWPGRVTGDSIADLDALPDDGAQQQFLSAARGQGAVTFPRVAPGRYTACVAVWLAGGALEPEPESIAVSCHPIDVAAKPTTQVQRVTPKLPRG